MSIQVKRIGKQWYKYEVTWDETEKKQRWRYVGKVTNDDGQVGKPGSPEYASGTKTLFFAAIAVSVLAGFFVHPYTYFWWDAHPLFFAIYGFVICMLIILGSKLLGHYIQRREDYYA